MKNKFQNIITLIKEDHAPIKEEIRIFTNENSRPAEKKRALKAFLKNLKIHAKAEEMSLYYNEVDDKKVRKPILEAYVEHAMAETLARKLESADIDAGLSDELEARAKVLAELVKHHLEEEESKMLVKLKEANSEERLEELGRVYLEAKRQVLEKFFPTPTAGSAPSEGLKPSQEPATPSSPNM